VEVSGMKTSMLEAKRRLEAPRKELPGEKLLTYTFLRCLGEVLPDEADPQEFLDACNRAIKMAMFERSTGLNLETLKLFAPLTQERFGELAEHFVSKEFGKLVTEERDRALRQST